MKKLIYSILLVFALPFLNMVNAEEVKGNLTEINSIPVLQLWGNHYERGYAYGNLMAEQIDIILVDYFIGYLLKNDMAQYATLSSVVNSILIVEDKYQNEAQGIAKGFNETPYANRFKELAGRDLEAKDMLFANSIVELESLFGCSAIMSWGDATMQDPSLQGELVITRHLDWQKVSWLYNNHIVIATNPDEEDEQRWVSFGFPGLFGCLSGVNESSLVAFQHMGNKPEGSIFGKQVEPIFLAIRNAIEMKDFNQDGQCNTADVFDAVGKNTTGGGFIVDAAGAIANGDSAIVIESSMDYGTVSRVLGENSNVSGTNLVATNHFRKLEPAIDCDRYDRLQEALSIDDQITVAGSWEVLKNAAGIPNNLQTIEVIPAENKILLSLSTEELCSWEIQATEFLFEDFFKTTGVEDNAGKVLYSVKAYPNPVVDRLNITMNAESDRNIEIVLCDLTGASLTNVFSGTISNQNEISIDMTDFAKGAYLLQIKSERSVSAIKIIK